LALPAAAKAALLRRRLALSELTSLLCLPEA
jgi:hypothetical protein